MDWRAKFQLALSIVTTLIFLGILIWGVTVRDSLLIAAIGLLFFIINAAVLYRTILLLRAGGPKVVPRRRKRS